MDREYSDWRLTHDPSALQQRHGRERRQDTAVLPDDRIVATHTRCGINSRVIVSLALSSCITLDVRHDWAIEKRETVVATLMKVGNSLVLNLLCFVPSSELPHD